MFCDFFIYSGYRKRLFPSLYKLQIFFISQHSFKHCHCFFCCHLRAILRCCIDNLQTAWVLMIKVYLVVICGNVH